MREQVAPVVQDVLDGLSKNRARKILGVRRLVVKTAREADVGEIVETTKWGQIAYHPKRPRIGTTIRVDASSEHLVLYVHCQTNLIAEYRARFPEFVYEGKRAVLFPLNQRLDRDAFAAMIELAFTYHRRKALA